MDWGQCMFTAPVQLQALTWRKCLCSQSHGHGMCPSFPVPQDHIFAVVSSSAIPEAEVSWLPQCIFWLSLEQSSCNANSCIHSLPARLTILALWAFEMLHVSECPCAVWNPTHEDGWGSEMLRRRFAADTGQSLSHSYVLRAFLGLWGLAHLTALLAARSSNYLKFSG